MSHFSVLVITPSKPSQEELATILQPWHEYECTGTEDQYVVDVDVTDKLLAEWNKDVQAVRLNGVLKSRYADEFYKEMAGGDPVFPKKEFVLPEGGEEVTVKQYELCEANGTTQAQFADEWGGWKLRDGRFYDRTNPNAKWDGWVVGGRWTGFLMPNYDPEEDPANKETCFLCMGTGKRPDMEVADGCNGCKGKGVSVKWPTHWRKTDGDQVRRGDLPLEELRLEAESRAAAEWEKFHKAKGDLPWPDWDAILDKHGGKVDKARDEYWGDPAIKKVQEAGILIFGRDSVEHLLQPKAECLANARARAIQTFAVVKDGKWYQRGEMGWWGIVSKEDEPEVWRKRFAELVDGLDADSWLTVVDCHI